MRREPPSHGPVIGGGAHLRYEVVSENRNGVGHVARLIAGLTQKKEGRWEGETNHSGSVLLDLHLHPGLAHVGTISHQFCEPGTKPG